MACDYSGGRHRPGRERPFSTPPGASLSLGAAPRMASAGAAAGRQLLREGRRRGVDRDCAVAATHAHPGSRTPGGRSTPARAALFDDQGARLLGKPPCHPRTKRMEIAMPGPDRRTMMKIALAGAGAALVSPAFAQPARASVLPAEFDHLV